MLATSSWFMTNIIKLSELKYFIVPKQSIIAIKIISLLVNVDDNIRGEIRSKLDIRLPGQSILGALSCPVPLNHSRGMLNLFLAGMWTAVDYSAPQ